MGYQVNIPEGSAGDWAVERFTVTPQEESVGRLRAVVSSCGRGRFVPAGTYTALKYRGQIVMSDTLDEIRDLREPLRKATGHCLVNGLGLGVVVCGMLAKEVVDHVTVIERSLDVIRLVGDHLQPRYGARLLTIQADAFNWKPPKGVRYDVVWHDIWSNICKDNLPDMHRLHRKYGRRCDWQASWCRWMCERRDEFL